jgi:hypothetical protein
LVTVDVGRKGAKADERARRLDDEVEGISCDDLLFPDDGGPDIGGGKETVRPAEGRSLGTIDALVFLRGRVPG